MGRWTTLTFTTPQILPGVPLSYDYALPASVIDFHSITITASVPRGGCAVEIYPTSARNTEPVYSTGDWDTTYVDPPITIGLPAEKMDPWKFCYSDDNVGSKLHLILYGGGVAKTLTFTIEYELPSIIDNTHYESVASYGADKTGVADSTSAFAAALVASRANQKPVFIPPGTYLITDTLNMYSNDRLIGSDYCRRSQQAGLSYVKFATRINFTPTSSKNFIHVQTDGIESYATNVYIGGFSVMGNSGSGFVPVSGNSNYGLLLDSVAQSTFENLGIYLFNIGIMETNGMRNRFQEIYSGLSVITNLRIGNAAGGYALETTDDCFIQCDFRDSLTSGVVVEYGTSTKFISCLFEENRGWGCDVWAESDADFISCDAETNGISVSNTGTFQFHVNHQAAFNPASSFVDRSTNIIGGMYSGYLGGTTFLSCGHSRSVHVSGTIIKSFLNGIVADATDTLIGGIHLTGVRMNVVGNPTVNPTKTDGGGFGYVICGEIGDLDMWHGPIRNQFCMDTIHTNKFLIGGSSPSISSLATAAQIVTALNNLGLVTKV